MNLLRAALAATILLAFSIPAFAQQEPVVSQKKDIAVFALGYYGYSIPSNVLATVDAEIQRVFVNLGRFNVLGQTVRFSTADINQFIEILRKSKEENTPLPEEVKFGEVQLTQALLNQLYGSFVVVIPTITSYTSEYNSTDAEYQTRIRTSVAFIDVAEGKTFGWAQINTSGSSEETQNKSIEGALSGIASQLEYEVRKIPAFTINSRILSANLVEARMQLGQDMGIRKGDEYAVIEKRDIMGFEDEVETGLIMVKDVGSNASSATILYGTPSSVKEGAQTREIPRQGVDLSLSLGYLRYFSTRYDFMGDEYSDGAVTFALGGVLTRGFYTFRPSFDIQVIIDPTLWYPINAAVGVDMNMYMRRLNIYGNISIVGGANVVLKILEEALEESDEGWISHFGISASVGASYLVSRDVKLYAEATGMYMHGIFSLLGVTNGPFGSYGGYGANVGVSFKL